MAVYTHITEETARAHLARFGIGALVSLDGIMDGVSNTNYKLVTTAGRYILTLIEARTDESDLPFFIAFMEHLKGKGIPCPGVIAAKDGRTVLPLNGRPCLITTFLDGASPEAVTPAQAAAMGAFTARLHKAALSFTQTRANSLALPAWKTLIKACAGPANLPADLLPLLVEELSYLERNAPQGLPAGAVHADLFPDNIFFSGEVITGVIDFYFACTEVFAYDLMLTLNAWCFEGGVFNAQKAGLFLDAYKNERPLTPAEEEALPHYGRAAALRIVATRLYDKLHPAPGALITPKDPDEYMKILSFHQQRASS